MFTCERTPRGPDGDLDAMASLHRMLAPNGRVILPIPVGRDMVCPPLHRIYGEQPRLIDKSEIVEEQFWVKHPGVGWAEASSTIALATEGSESFYSLGLFVLKPR